MSEDLSQPTVIAGGEIGGADSRFRIIKTLGAGGMGEVYLAEDSKLHRRVAIKTIRADLCRNVEVRKRIERECLLHAKVGPHPHIVTLFDKLEHGDEINLVMEFVEGETLQALLEHRAKEGVGLSKRESLLIVAQTLDALARIHAHGVVHRDIKPSNIILARETDADSGKDSAICAKLMDFGISRLEEDSDQYTYVTQTGSSPGTPLYMAPEQIDPGTFGAVSYATDLYAVGVMLYQLLSGQPPFVGTLTEIYNGHLNRTPPPLTISPDDGIPEAIVSLLQRALAKKASARFASAKAFRDELLNLLGAATDSFARVQTSGVSATPTDVNRTLVASQSGGTAFATPGSTMLAGASATGASVRRKRKVALLATVGVLCLGVFGGTGWALYHFLGSGGSERVSAPSAEKQSAALPEAPSQPPPDSPASVPVASAQPAPVPVFAPPVSVPATTPTVPVSTASTPPQASSDSLMQLPQGSSAMDALLVGLDKNAPEPVAATPPPPKTEPPPNVEPQPKTEPKAQTKGPATPKPKSQDPSQQLIDAHKKAVDANPAIQDIFKSVDATSSQTKPK